MHFILVKGALGAPFGRRPRVLRGRSLRGRSLRGAAVKAWGTAVKARGAAVKARGIAVKARRIAIKARARRGYGDTKGPGYALNTRSCALYFEGVLKISSRGFGLAGRTKTLPCLNCVPYLQHVIKNQKSEILFFRKYFRNFP